MPPKKSKKKKTKRRNNSDSSTPQSSVPSVDDDSRPLLEGATGGSSKSRESRSSHKTKSSEKARSLSRLVHQSLGMPSQNIPRAGESSENLLVVPGEESGTRSPKSPRRRSPIVEAIIDAISPKKKSSCSKSDLASNVNTHEPNCPELKNLEAQTKVEHPKMGSDESKPSSSGASPVILKKNLKDKQSSSSSDPSVSDIKKGARGKDLTVPDQECAPKSPKVDPRAFVKKLISKASGKGSCETKSDRELEHPEHRKRGEDSKVKSEASSSSGSPIILKKDKRGEESNASSGKSKLSSISDPITVESSTSNEANKNLNKPGIPQIVTDCDPQEGTSRGATRDEPGELAEGYDANPPVHVDVLNLPLPRKRTTSLKTCLKLLQAEYSRSPSPSRYPWYQEVRAARKDATESELSPYNREGNERRFLPPAGTVRPGAAEYSRSPSPSRYSWYREARAARNETTESELPPYNREGNERRFLPQAGTVRPDAAVRRHQSSSPVRLRNCSCGAGNEGFGHKIGCSRQVDLRLRRRRRRCRQEMLI